MKERGIPKLSLGLITGIIFGFLLQKGGVTDYNVLIGQLLLKDFTVIKIIITAIITGMIGIYFMNEKGYVNLHTKSGSLGSVIIGGLLFGIGFGLLGYCPGTVAGAVGQGSLDALFGGVVGMIIGAGAFAHVYPFVQKKFLNYGKFKNITILEVVKIEKWKVISIFSGGLILVLIVIELLGY